jgi:hypothetical protein
VYYAACIIRHTYLAVLIDSPKGTVAVVPVHVLGLYEKEDRNTVKKRTGEEEKDNSIAQ